MGAPKRLLSQTDARLIVASFEHRMPPEAIVAIPIHCLGKATFEVFFGCPAQFGFQFRRIDGIAAIMSGPVFDERNEASPGTTLLRNSPVEQIANGHHVKISSLVAPADVVGLANSAAFEHETECRGVILDVGPVANILAVAVNRQ